MMNFFSRRNFSDIDRIEPYSFLNISENSKPQEVKMAYMKLATVPDRTQRMKACLSYNIICKKSKYIKEGNFYRVQYKDCFNYTVICLQH